MTSYKVGLNHTGVPSRLPILDNTTSNLIPLSKITRYYWQGPFDWFLGGFGLNPFTQ